MDATYFIARRAFGEIAKRFPALQMIEEPDAPVEISIHLPVQPGLKYTVWLALQNDDELHFSVEHFWLEWFPCTDPLRVERYVRAVTGFISGDFRILEFSCFGHCFKAKLQAPNGDGWETIGTWGNLGLRIPFLITRREVRNA